MRPRRPRALTSEERRLWTHVAREVRPLPGRALPEPEPATPERLPEPSEPPGLHAAPSPAAKVPAGPVLPPLSGLEPKTRTALRRGRRRAEAVIDLHGLRQTEAHDRLLAFLRRSQQRGDTVVLVITGKGAAEGAAERGLSPEAGLGFGERGVLRRMVPHWLRLPEMRHLIVGFEEAAIHHGGAGALYVRLRRPRQMFDPS